MSELSEYRENLKKAVDTLYKNVFQELKALAAAPYESWHDSHSKFLCGKLEAYTAIENLLK